MRLRMLRLETRTTDSVARLYGVSKGLEDQLNKC